MKLRSKTLLLLKRKFKDQLFGVLSGLIVSSVIAIVVWLFAYFGYINLGLPQRYAFENIQATITKYIPPRFNVTYDVATNFRQPDTKSLIITARDERFADYRVRDVKSDIILIFDSKDSGYELSYRFQPSAEYPLHILDVEKVDLNEDGLVEVVVEWANLGAHFSDHATTVIKHESNKTRLFGIPQLIAQDYGNYEGDHFNNVYNPRETLETFRSSYVIAKKGELAVVNRNHETCHACADEDHWSIHFLKLESDGFKRYRSPILNVLGFRTVERLLKEQEYPVVAE